MSLDNVGDKIHANRKIIVIILLLLNYELWQYIRPLEHILARKSLIL